MTVAELIKKLREMPQDAVVVTPGGHLEYSEVATDICLSDAYIERNGETSLWLERDADKGHVKVAIVSLY